MKFNYIPIEKEYIRIEFGGLPYGSFMMDSKNTWIYRPPPQGHSVLMTETEMEELLIKLKELNHDSKKTRP